MGLLFTVRRDTKGRASLLRRGMKGWDFRWFEFKIPVRFPYGGAEKPFILI